jgi:catechol 2,3-dioxygenase-like lactoylglutathione lyase family enzyme
MTAQLNHTIVAASDREKAAAFLTELLGLPDATSFGPFLVVELGNGVSMDFMAVGEDVTPQHYAFLVSEDEFDEIFGRIRERGLAYWADPGQQQPGKIYHSDGGRGVYWDDPDGHRLEILTRPYGSGDSGSSGGSGD